MLGEILIAVEVLSAVVECAVVALYIAEKLGIIEPGGSEKTVENLGDKALQAREEGIRPENYDTYDKYMDVIKDFQIDPEKSKEFSELEKQKKGLELLLCSIEEKTENHIGRFLEEMYKDTDFYTKERVNTYLEVFCDKKLDLDKITSYYNGNLKQTEYEKVHEALVESEKNLNPDKTEGDIETIIEKRLEKR